MRSKLMSTFVILLVALLGVSLNLQKTYALTTGNPTGYPLLYGVTAKDDGGISNGITSVTLSEADGSNFVVGETIIIDVNGTNYEFRDITSVSTDFGETTLSFTYELQYNHSAGAIVQKYPATSTVFDSSVKVGTDGGTKGANQVSIQDPNKRLKVGDTVLINPNSPIGLTVTAKNGDGSKIRLSSVTDIAVNDKILAKRSTTGQETTATISAVDPALKEITISPAIGWPIAEYKVYLSKIEKSQIIGITYDGSNNPSVLTLKTNLKFNHSANEPVILTNTAASMYEHDSGYLNNQSQGAQPTTTMNGEPNMPITSGPHGKYTSNTNACGRCHQLHAAQAPKLVRFPIAASANATNPIYATCTFCHTFNGQSTYDVKNGQIWDTADGKRYATNGGGFERMLVVEGAPENATLVKVTSKHRVDAQAIRQSNGSYSFVKFNAPGGYPESNGHVELTCTKCHQPHGTRNGRQLVESVQTKDKNGVDITRATFQSGVNIKVENPFQDERTRYNSEIVDFCAACHYDYAQSTDGSTPAGYYDPTKYRHKMKMTANSGFNNGTTISNLGMTDINRLVLPTGTLNGQINTVICTTCHYAHGTFTTMEGIRQYDEIKLNSTTNLNTVGGWETPKNLRLDNRGVCQNCHNRFKDTVPPALADILNPAFAGNDIYGSSTSLKAGQKAGSFTTDSIMIRFNQYMWTNPAGKDYVGYKNDVENPAQYTVTRRNLDDSNPVTLTITSTKLQPDGRTLIINFDANSVPAGYKYEVLVKGDANNQDIGVYDLNWNKTTVNQSVTFTK